MPPLIISVDVSLGGDGRSPSISSQVCHPCLQLDFPLELGASSKDLSEDVGYLSKWIRCCPQLCTTPAVRRTGEWASVAPLVWGEYFHYLHPRTVNSNAATCSLKATPQIMHKSWTSRSLTVTAQGLNGIAWGEPSPGCTLSACTAAGITCTSRTDAESWL